MANASIDRILEALKYTVCGVALLVFPLISLVPVLAEEINSPNCPLKKLNGSAAQEMMVKGVIMHTELEKHEKTTHIEYTFVHTVRADWTIWICIQGANVKDGQPDDLRLSCTACDY